MKHFAVRKRLLWGCGSQARGVAVGRVKTFPTGMRMFGIDVAAMSYISRAGPARSPCTPADPALCPLLSFHTNVNPHLKCRISIQIRTRSFRILHRHPHKPSPRRPSARLLSMARIPYLKCMTGTSKTLPRTRCLSIQTKMGRLPQSRGARPSKRTIERDGSSARGST